MASDSIINGGNKLFDYSLRVSQRAKYAKLQFKPYGGLEVVVPRNFPQKAVPELISRHAGWIEQHLAKQQQRYPEIALPQLVSLAFDQSQTEVLYQSPVRQARLNRQHQLCITNVDYQHSVDQLRQWIRLMAWRQLPPMLERISRQTGLDYRKVSIRSQKSRWGSCSSRGTISLNDQLMFVPADTAEYLMIHELCHRRHLNHSTRFWHLVEQKCPDFRNHEAVLDRAKSSVPDWFLRDLYR